MRASAQRGELVVEVSAQEWRDDLIPEEREAARREARKMRMPTWDDLAAAGDQVQVVRSAAEQNREWRRCFEQMDRLAKSGVRSMGDMPPQGRALYGLWDAARWSTGRAAEAPVWRRAVPFTGVVMLHEIALAREVVRVKGDEWEQAVGALVWLRWLIGEKDEITYPLW